MAVKCCVLGCSLPPTGGEACVGTRGACHGVCHWFPWGLPPHRPLTAIISNFGTSWKQERALNLPW